MSNKQKKNFLTENRTVKDDSKKDGRKRKNVLSERKDTCYNDGELSEPGEYEAFWQSLTITDDFIFGKIMQDRQICIELLRLIFPRQDIQRIEYIKTQESIRLDKEAKGIRLDVFVKDSKNTAFCVELQTRNEDNLPKRSRYYQSLVDLELLDRGQDYDSLSPCYIIFICAMDLFHTGHHVYEFRNYCTHDRKLELGDQAAKIFLNARGERDDISPGLKEFLDYVAGKENDSPSEFIDKLEQALYHAKQNREWRRERMMMYFRDMDIRADALKEGEQKKEKEMILSMLANGATREFVKQVASITDEELDALLTDIN